MEPVLPPADEDFADEDFFVPTATSSVTGSEATFSDLVVRLSSTPSTMTTSYSTSLEPSLPSLVTFSVPESRLSSSVFFVSWAIV